MRKSKRIFVLTAMLFSLLCFPANRVLAVLDTAEVSLVVKQKFEVKNPEKAELTGDYELRAMDEDIPMPENKEDAAYSFSLKGEQAETTISLHYLHAGVYHYQLLQTTKDKEAYQYDRSCYTITVYVENGKEGQLIPQVIAEKEDGKKYGTLEFQNICQGEKTESPGPSQAAKTGDATHITIYLLLAAGSWILLAGLKNKKIS